jgi:hypothetical protein
VADPIDKVVRTGSQKGTMHALAPTLSHWTLQINGLMVRDGAFGASPP